MPIAFPRLDEALDVVALRVRELEGGKQAAGLGGIVVLDRGFEVLAQRRALA